MKPEEYMEAFETCRRPITAMIGRVLRKYPADVPDIVQETAHKGLSHLDRFEDRAALQTWLHKIALNEALQHRRKMERKHEELLESNAYGDQRAICDSRISPFQYTYQRELKAIFDDIEQKLPAHWRVVYHLRYKEDLRFNEIAETLGISLGTVQSRLSRLGGHLESKLSKYYYGPRRPLRAAQPLKRTVYTV